MWSISNKAIVCDTCELSDCVSLWRYCKWRTAVYRGIDRESTAGPIVELHCNGCCRSLNQVDGSTVAVLYIYTYKSPVASEATICTRDPVCRIRVPQQAPFPRSGTEMVDVQLSSYNTTDRAASVVSELCDASYPKKYGYSVFLGNGPRMTTVWK